MAEVDVDFTRPVERGALTCLACGKPHWSYAAAIRYGGDQGWLKAAPQWASPDGHDYRPETWEAHSERLEAEAGRLLTVLRQIAQADDDDVVSYAQFAMRTAREAIDVGLPTADEVRGSHD